MIHWNLISWRYNGAKADATIQYTMMRRLRDSFIPLTLLVLGVGVLSAMLSSMLRTDQSVASSDLQALVVEDDEDLTSERALARPTAPPASQMAPDFRLSALSGEQVSLSDFRGTHVILNFWATWCVPCRYEMPALENIHQQEEVVVLAINMEETVAAIEPFVSELSLTFPILLDEDADVATLYGVRGLPTSVFINRDGTIQARHVGAMDETSIREVLADMP